MVLNVHRQTYFNSTRPFRQNTLHQTFIPLPKHVSRAKLAWMEPASTRPQVGRRISLELHPAQPITWIGPAWAAVCGALASGAFALSGETVLRILIAIILADPILGAWRAAWVNTDWRAPLRVWQPTPTRSWMLLPYARLNSPAARLSQWISSRAKFWRDAVWPEVGLGLSTLLIFGAIALCLALVLDGATFQRGAFLLTVIALALGPLEAEMGARGAGQWARASLEVGAAWLIGNAALATPNLDSVLIALFLACAYRGLLALANSREIGFAIANLSQIVVSALLVARGAILNAGFLSIGLIAQLLWQAAARRVGEFDSTYLLRVQWFLLLAMLAAALGVPH
jgi:hypothetical protein